MSNNQVNIPQYQGQVQVLRRIQPTANYLLGFDSNVKLTAINPASLVLSGDTLTLPTIADGLLASGSVSNDFSASTGAFKTSSGANTLSGDVSVAAGKDIVYAAGDGVLDASLGTGIFKSTTGAGTLSGSTAMAANKNLSCAAGTSALDFSLGTGVTKTTTGVNTIGGPMVMTAGTTAIAPLQFVSGTNLTTAITGGAEYDGAVGYFTGDVTGGRGHIPSRQYFRLTSNGSTISTIANYFGTTSNISLVASAFYEIEIFAFFLNSTSGTVVWTLTNSATPTKQNIVYEASPATGIVAPPGTATMLQGQVIGDATAALALTATSALTDAVNHYTRMKIWLQNGTGTSLKIQATKSAGSITPLVGSYYTATRLPAASTGTFAA